MHQKNACQIQALIRRGGRNPHFNSRSTLTELARFPSTYFWIAPIDARSYKTPRVFPNQMPLLLQTVDCLTAAVRPRQYVLGNPPGPRPFQPACNRLAERAAMRDNRRRSAQGAILSSLRMHGPPRADRAAGGYPP